MTRAPRGTRWVKPLVLAGALLAPVLARAADPQPGGQKEADALFIEGRELLEKGRYLEACPKLKRSEELSAAVGTLINLGYCWEQLGKYRSAMDAYAEAEVLASSAGDAKRTAFAKERFAAVEPRATKLVVRVAPNQPSGLEITRNGTSLPLTDLDHAIPVDPEDYVIAASAPGHETWKGAFIVRGEGAVVTVIVPPLTASAASGGAPSSAPLGGRRIAALSLGGVALATVGAGLATALSAKSRHDDAAAHCDDRGCDEIGVTLQHGAAAQGNVATALVAFGLVSAAAGVYLWIAGAPGARAAPATPAAKASARLELSPLGAALGGSF